jgi:signal transduction histidine kinase
VSAADLPFLQLVSATIEADLENVLLNHQLRAFTAQLEKKVEERTADLARSNSELEVSLRRVRETQEELVEAGKTAAILTLVEGLSHELNNPIGVILGCAQGLLARVAPDPTWQRPLEAIERQAKRCGQLVKALLGFAANRSPALARVAPAKLLQHVAADLYSEATERGVELRISPVATDLPLLSLDVQNIRAALKRLVRNALDATSSGGAVEINVRERELDLVAGVEFTVLDSGTGIPAALLPRIFDPFFTTKPPGKGVGLGLSLARQSIESHGGRIEVQSAVGRGTTVRAWLPAAADDRSQEGQGRAAGGSL